MVIDTHAHLTFPPLAANPAAVIARAAAASVTRIITPAYDTPSWPAIAALAAAHPGAVYPALGLHPWVAHQPLDLDALAAALRDTNAVAIGEIGLDSKIQHEGGPGPGPDTSDDTAAAIPDLPTQLTVFQRQLELAADLDLPVILHCRGAFDHLIDCLERFTPRLRGVIHAFTRSEDLARRLTGLGLHLGVGGAVTRPNAVRTRRTAAAMPLECLVLETDAPAIGLEGVAPEDTEPRHVRDVAAALADLRGDTLAHVAEVTTAAATALFDLDR
jgi:TatD DNase family protein